MQCTACIMGYWWECEHGGNCTSVHPISILSSKSNVAIEGSNNMDETDLQVGVYVPGMPERIIREQDNAKLIDQQSTGRKRAAEMYPLYPEELCEWAGKKNCGGGATPIVGCENNKQQARHHGPDKNTLNNDPGNVHRICHTCHNRWHAANDADYIWNSIYPKHNPEPADVGDRIVAEMIWAGTEVKAVVD